MLVAKKFAELVKYAPFSLKICNVVENMLFMSNNGTS